MQKILMIPQKPKQNNKAVRTCTVLKTCQKFIKVAGEKINNHNKNQVFPYTNNEQY